MRMMVDDSRGTEKGDREGGTEKGDRGERDWRLETRD